jgi:hypothetical protein
MEKQEGSLKIYFSFDASPNPSSINANCFSECARKSFSKNIGPRYSSESGVMDSHSQEKNKENTKIMKEYSYGGARALIALHGQHMRSLSSFPNSVWKRTDSGNKLKHITKKVAFRW